MSSVSSDISICKKINHVWWNVVSRGNGWWIRFEKLAARRMIIVAAEK